MASWEPRYDKHVEVWINQMNENKDLYINET